MIETDASVHGHLKNQLKKSFITVKSVSELQKLIIIPQFNVTKIVFGHR